MIRRLLVLCLAAMLVLAFGACSTPSATTTPTTAAPTASPTEAPTASPTPTPSPLVTLDVFSAAGNSAGLQDNWWGNFIKEKLNVQLNVLPNGEGKLEALMASGELPDIVNFQGMKSINDAVKGNMLLCLDDNIAKLPDVTKNAPIALQYYRDNASNGTGKAYAMGGVVGPGGAGAELNWGPYLRYDLYKQLGNPEIKTVEDYLPLLQKMQALEPKTADGQKVYAFTLWKDWDVYAYAMHAACQVSVLSGYDTGDQMGGKLPLLQINFNNLSDTMSDIDPNSQYIRALKFYFQANQMGLVDPDSLTQKYTSGIDKLNAGRILFGWWSWFVAGYNTPDRTNADSPKGFVAIQQDGYKAFTVGVNKVGQSLAWSIGAATKNADACLSFIDLMYTPDALMTLYNGPKGVTWDIGSDGKPAYTAAGWDCIDNAKDLPGGGKLSDGTGFFNNPGLAGGFISPDYNVPLSGSMWDSSKGHNATKLAQEWTADSGYKTTYDKVKALNMCTVMPDAVGFVPVMPDDIAALAKQISDVVITDSWKMVFAKDQAEFDSLLKDMTDKANGLGIDQLIAWDNQAWQTAQATAAKYSK